MKTVYLSEGGDSATQLAERWRSDAQMTLTLPGSSLNPARGRALKAQAGRDAAWGIAASIDIYNCNPATIRDPEAIRRFVVELCDLIEMKRYGECQVVHFGEDARVAGYSMVQLIETSLISAHFANLTNTVYLDVFSCKPYDPAQAEQFALAFFEGSHCATKVNLRM